MGRGRGKGKAGRGGKLFVANIEELQMREAQVEETKLQRKNRRGDSDDEEDDDDDEVGGGGGDEELVFEKETIKKDKNDELRELANFERASRLSAKQKEQQEEVEEEEEEKPRGGLLQGFQTQNPNVGSKNPKQMKTKDMLKSMEEGTEVEQAPLSRREREAQEAARKKADYERRHAAGETDEARADLARLAEVRRRREEAKVKREKEEARQKLVEAGLPVGSDDEQEEEEDEKEKPKVSSEKRAANAAKKKAAAEEDDSDVIPVLSSIEIKKLKPDVLKEHLKTRGLSTQGQKKDLMQRLIDHEASRK